jgi:hypothetical protein
VVSELWSPFIEGLTTLELKLWLKLCSTMLGANRFSLMAHALLTIEKER